MEKNNQQLIKDVKERLAWYTLEASEEEFDEKEVEALVQLLTVLEGNKEEDDKESQAALERFWKFRDKRMAEDSGHIGSGAIPDSSKRKKVQGRKRAVRRWYMPVAAAVVVFLVFVGGSFGSIAEKNNGFFYWLKRDKTGATFITNPENLDVVTEQNCSKSYEPDEVPEEYKEYVVDREVIESLESLKGFELQEVAIMQSDGRELINSFLVKQETEEKICIGIAVYPYKVRYVTEGYDAYEYEYIVEPEGMEYELLSKPNPTGGTDYVVIFYAENKQYALSNHGDSQKLIEVARQYYQLYYS